MSAFAWNRNSFFEDILSEKNIENVIYILKIKKQTKTTTKNPAEQKPTTPTEYNRSYISL